MAFQMNRASGVNICHFSRRLRALQSGRAAHGAQRTPFLPLFSLPDHASAGGLLQHAGGHCAADAFYDTSRPRIVQVSGSPQQNIRLQHFSGPRFDKPAGRNSFRPQKGPKTAAACGFVENDAENCDNLRVCCKTATQKCYKQRLY